MSETREGREGSRHNPIYGAMGRVDEATSELVLIGQTDDGDDVEIARGPIVIEWNDDGSLNCFRAWRDPAIWGEQGDPPHPLNYKPPTPPS